MLVRNGFIVVRLLPESFMRLSFARLVDFEGVFLPSLVNAEILRKRAHEPGSQQTPKGPKPLTSIAAVVSKPPCSQAEQALGNRTS
jgi:hypothetical protein